MLKALTLTSKGTYSGTLINQRRKKGFSGSFSLGGQAINPSHSAARKEMWKWK